MDGAQLVVSRNLALLASLVLFSLSLFTYFYGVPTGFGGICFFESCYVYNFPLRQYSTGLLIEAMVFFTIGILSERMVIHPKGEVLTVKHTLRDAED